MNHTFWSGSITVLYSLRRNPKSSTSLYCLALLQVHPKDNTITITIDIILHFPISMAERRRFNQSPWKTISIFQHSSSLYEDCQSVAEPGMFIRVGRNEKGERSLKQHINMKFLNLLFTSSVPVLEVLIVTALGAFIATDRIALLSEEARNYMNRVVFYVFNPALVSSNLADAVTFTTLIELWFMPINVFLTFLLGSALGWMVIILTRTPRHLRALILGVCSAGNLGNLLLIIVPAMCSETGGTFGDSATCRRNGLAYASLSMALGSIFIWTYVYNVMRISARNVVAKRIISSDHSEFAGETSETPSYSHTEEPLIPCKSTESEKVPVHVKCLRWLKTFAAMINLKNILPPSIYGAIVGFCVGSIPPVRKLIIGDNAPLRVIETSASLVGQGAVPTITLILGGNLLSGLKGAGVKKIIIVGVLVVRFILLPMIGIAVVRGAHHFGFVKSDPLYQFVLMLQYALPPATNISTMSQLFKAGGTECSVLMLWTYIFAAFAITLWATLFMIIVA